MYLSDIEKDHDDPGMPAFIQADELRLFNQIAAYKCPHAMCTPM